MLTAACLALAAAPAAAATPSTHTVPVTQPDELGGAVALDTDVYLPAGSPPSGGWPLLIYFHGGGNQKREGIVTAHADAFTAEGYAVLAFSARGHGNSTGHTVVAGPKEMRDLFDVADWALRSFPLDRSRIALGGESQGGLYTNGGQAHSAETDVNPYGIRFRALIPGNTPDYVYDALAPSGVVKLSFGLGLIQTYLVGAQGRMSPLVLKWIGTMALDLPEILESERDLCDSSGHDALLSPTKADLAYRSPGCHLDRMTIPSYWAQSFDDGLFTPEMAISMWRRMPNPANRIYLTMGGHAAPLTPANAERDELAEQVRFVNSILKPEPVPVTGVAPSSANAVRGAQLIERGRRLVRRGKRLLKRGQRRKGRRLIRRGRRLIREGAALAARSGAGAGGRADQPEVVYWRRDPRVAVPSNSYKYPEDAWTRHVSPTWPPPGTQEASFQLGAAGPMPLLPITVDPANDPVLTAALAATPIGTSPIPAQLPATNFPGLIAGFPIDPSSTDRELSGQVHASLAWTPLTPDSQLVLKLFDRAPDGTMTLLSRGVEGIRGATPGVERQVEIAGQETSALIPAGHSLLAWVSAGELGFFKPYLTSLGGILGAGPGSTLSIPLRRP